MKTAVLLCTAVAIAVAPTPSQADRHDGAIRALLDDMLLSIQASGAGRGALLSEGPPRNTGAPGGGGYRIPVIEVDRLRQSIIYRVPCGN